MPDKATATFSFYIYNNAYFEAKDNLFYKNGIEN